MALTVFLNAFSKTPLPMVPSTSPSTRPLRFLPSRTTTASRSVVPSGRLLATSMARPRFQTNLLAAFASLAICLALAGVYGVLSYHVSQRVHEIGVPMCLGASGRDVIWLFVRQAMAPVTLGTALGLVGAVWTARIVAGLLFGVNPLDLLTFLAPPVLLLVGALLAIYLPARRATRVEASVALQAN